jgi:2-oxoglutarate ferredoxin oxidoreductase subunit beta
MSSITNKDFATDQDIRWCPGCGDYSILKQVQTIMPELGIPREEIVFVSGIGCSSRFPYYMNTYGMHSIHGRASSIATGLKTARPELNVWIVTGDGDALSIGGNHLIHLLRRNVDVNILLFNNEIYGLTKGQYSPTSPEGTQTKSSPMGSVDHPFNPAALALGADATFVARAMDRDVKHLRDTLLRSQQHKGTSFLEIYQNCNVFNDGAFSVFTEKDSKPLETLFVEHGKPLIFGAAREKGIVLDGLRPVVVELSHVSENDLWVHDETDYAKATLLSRMFDRVTDDEDSLPRPFGVLYAVKRPCYEVQMAAQISKAIAQKGPGDLDALIKGRNSWEIV